MNLSRQSEANLPTDFGLFRVIAYAEDDADPMPHLAIVGQPLQVDEPTLVRVHSECLTGDILHSLRCDCGEQLAAALRRIGEEGGAIIYLRQEGRGIGIINKLRAYELQDAGADTVQANHQLGFPADGRNYACAVAILRDLGISRVRLLTNNPEKVQALDSSGIEVVQREPIEIEPRPENSAYLATKRDRMGHFLRKRLG